MKKSTAFLIAVIAFLSGLIAGFLLSPIKDWKLHINVSNTVFPKNTNKELQK
ncbi:MAG: hypothetical protein II711_02025 [Clostridia bacterium]|nr:hypothetical protein [Clostridia bacterium]